MFLVGLIYYLIPKNWITSDLGLKIPFSLENRNRIDSTNKFFGKALLYGAVISSIVCFLIGLSPLKYRINESVYVSLDMLVILILVFITEVNLRFKKFLKNIFKLYS
jgi:uncharacterized membrane protein